jgi:hypothetical protein
VPCTAEAAIHLATVAPTQTALLLLLTAHPEAVLAQTRSTGDTPLHCAVRAGNEHSVCAILSAVNAMSEAPARDIRTLPNFAGMTALSEAARMGHLPLLRMLVDGRFASETVAASVDPMAEDALVAAALQCDRVHRRLLLHWVVRLPSDLSAVVLRSLVGRLRAETWRRLHF